MNLGCAHFHASIMLSLISRALCALWILNIVQLWYCTNYLLKVGCLPFILLGIRYLELACNLAGRAETTVLKTDRKEKILGKTGVAASGSPMALDYWRYSHSISS